MIGNFALFKNGQVYGFDQLGVSQGEPAFELSPFEFLDNLPGYDGSEGNIAMLDQLRLVTLAQSYFPIQRVFPNESVDDLTFTARTTKEKTISVPTGSFLTAIAGYSEQGEGFDFQIFDRGAKTSLVQGKNLGHNTLFAPDIEFNSVDPTGPFIVTSPLAVLDPGQVTFEITNRATVDNVIQLALYFAMPLTNENLNVVEIKEV